MDLCAYVMSLFKLICLIFIACNLSEISKTLRIILQKIGK